MEPGLRDREYPVGAVQEALWWAALQWSPVLETGNTLWISTGVAASWLLQWSPVLETGNTPRVGRSR